MNAHVTERNTNFEASGISSIYLFPALCHTIPALWYLRKSKIFIFHNVNIY